MTKAQAEKHTARTGNPCKPQRHRCACGRTWTEWVPLDANYRPAPPVWSGCEACEPQQQP